MPQTAASGEAWERASAKAKGFALVLTIDEATATVNENSII